MGNKTKKQIAANSQEETRNRILEVRPENLQNPTFNEGSSTSQANQRSMKTFWHENNLLDKDIPYPLTNDYLARVLLQARESVLRSILCAVLGIQPEEIRSLTIKNPIVPGEEINEKEFVMDVKALLNEDITVDLEIQVINLYDWPERSLQYLCRSFDALAKGENYRDSKTAIHIGILDFKLFKDTSQYYSSYRLMEIKTHRVYTEKFQLYTLCLPLLGHATESDRLFLRDMWGAFFKVKKWKELYEMATVYPVIEDAAEEIFGCLADSKIREKIEARQDYERRQRMIQSRIADLEEKNRKNRELLAEKDDKLAEKDNQLAVKDNQLAEKDNQLANKDAQIAELKRLLEQTSSGLQRQAP